MGREMMIDDIGMVSHQTGERAFLNGANETGKADDISAQDRREAAFDEIGGHGGRQVYFALLRC